MCVRRWPDFRSTVVLCTRRRSLDFAFASSPPATTTHGERQAKEQTVLNMSMIEIMKMRSVAHMARIFMHSINDFIGNAPSVLPL